MRRPLLTLLTWLSTLAAPLAYGGTPAELPTASWQTLLTKFVRTDGGVDYLGLVGEAQALEAFVKAHAALDVKGADDKTRKAVYINLYNATMMLHLLQYAKAEKIDVASKDFLALEINKIKAGGGNLWTGPKIKLAGLDVTLDDIEHNLIRGKGDGKLGELKVGVLDPRIHAAVNCAALSCPRVRETAYLPENVDALLDENAREFLSSEAQFSKADNDTLKANQIVYWYYDDFDDVGEKNGKGGAGGFLADFVAPTAKDRDWKIKHLKDNFNDRGKISLKLSSAFNFHYDWHVNDRRNKQ